MQFLNSYKKLFSDNTFGIEEWSLFPFACAYGWLDVLKILHIFSKIEDINARYRINDPKLTPLMLACQSNQLEVAEFLLSSFDDIDIN